MIDEYDTPFQQAMLSEKTYAFAEEVRTFVAELFNELKDNGEHLRLVLIMGVSKLGLPTLESDPKNYIDLTYDEKFASAFGFTSEEIEDFYPEIIHRFKLENNTDEKMVEFITNLKEHYGGHNFAFRNSSQKKDVFNPVSTLKCLVDKKFGRYWSNTVNSHEVTRRMFNANKQLETSELLKKFEHSKSLRRDIELVRNPAAGPIPLIILMLQRGYFTIQSYDEKTEEVVLDFPNKEVVTLLEDIINRYQAFP